MSQKILANFSILLKMYLFSRQEVRLSCSSATFSQAVWVNLELLFISLPRHNMISHFLLGWKRTTQVSTALVEHEAVLRNI